MEPRARGRPGRGHRGGRAALRPRRREALRALRARADAEGAGAGQGAVAAHPQARRARRARLGSGGPPGVGQVRPHERRGRPDAGRALAQRPTGRRGRGRRGRRHRAPPTGELTGPTEEELEAAGGARREGSVDARRPPPQPDQPRQGALPRPGRRAAGDEAGPDRLLRPHRADRAALPRRAAGQRAPPPRRRRPTGLLAEEGPLARAGLADAVALPRRRPGRDRVVRRGRQRAEPRVAGQLRRGRAAPLDLDRRRSPPADVGAHRHRPRSRDRVRGRAGAGPAPPHRARAPRRGRAAAGQRPAGHPDLHPARRGVHLRPDAGAGSSRSPGPSAPPSPSW